jgi:hypothetical protein
MKTILLLKDEIAQARLLLQNAAPGKVTLDEAEAVAGCNCDRWGHPCPRCVNADPETKAERPFSMLLDE